jgi:PAS domain S-box-containing protein
MQNDRAGDSEHGLNGLNPTQMLEQCLASAVIIINPQKQISSFNREAGKLLGLEASQARPHSVEALPQVLRDAIVETFSTAQPQTKEFPLQTGTGGEIPLHIHTSLHGAGHERGGVIAVLTDLTPFKNLEQHLRHLDCLASIGTLAAGMAHEIKNALVAVKTFLDLLISKNKDADLADVVGREFKRIDYIVSQMLKFAGPAKPTFAVLHLHEVIEHSLRLVGPQLAGKKIHLKKTFTASPDLARGDSYQLEQALLNLLFNAIEAMSPNGELAVSTDLAPASGAPDIAEAAKQSKLSLRIKDSGIGIPPENLPRLFDPFFTTKKKGNGLGLSITRRIIHEHGGTITVESEVGRGTTFTLLLPRANKY